MFFIVVGLENGHANEMNDVFKNEVLIGLGGIDFVDYYSAYNQDVFWNYENQNIPAWDPDFYQPEDYLDDYILENGVCEYR